VVRSNISTIVDFDLLTYFLKTNTLDYGGYKNIIKTIDELAGIVDKKYFGLDYASGTSILLSKLAIEHIIYNTDKIKFNLIDDVAIGLFIRENTTAIVKYIPNTLFVYVENPYCKNTYIFYRNRHTNRKLDIEHMKIIVGRLNHLRGVQYIPELIP
jgi:hypothetical protein